MPGRLLKQSKFPGIFYGVDASFRYWMRGSDDNQEVLFSYVSMERRIPEDHPLRPLRSPVDEVFEEMTEDFESLYSKAGRPSIPTEQWLRALLLQSVCTIRSERRLFRLQMDDPVWKATTFTKNRDRLLDGKIPKLYFIEKASRVTLGAAGRRRAPPGADKGYGTRRMVEERRTARSECDAPSGQESAYE